MALFIALTAVMTWPLPRHAGSAVQDLGDPLYEIWTMRWVQHQLVADAGRLWDGNVAYPFPSALLFSEPRLSTAVLAWPIQLLTGNDVLTYNVMLLSTFVLVGVGMALLVIEITDVWGAGVLAGVAAAYAPYRYGHLSHLNLLSYGWLPLALWLIVRFARRRSPIDATLAAVLLVIQVLASDTLAVMALATAGLAVLFVAVRPTGPVTRRFIGDLLLILAAPIAALLPIVRARLAVNERYGFARDLDTVRGMAATLESYVSVSPGNDHWSGILPAAYPNPLFPGVVAVLGLILALLFGRRFCARWTLYGLTLVLIGFVLSLGPDTEMAGRTITLPYRWLYDSVPGLSSQRDVARFGMLVLLGTQLLAGIGFAAAWDRLRSRLPVNTRRLVGPVLLTMLALAAIFELRTSVGTIEVPRDPGTVAVYDWLADQPPGPVIELPANGFWKDPSWTTRQIYASTRHWHPIMAGYTSFLPDRYVELLVALHGGTEPDSRVTPDNVGLLADLGVRYVVIHRQAGYDWQAALAAADALPELSRVTEMGDAVVYTITAAPRERVRLEAIAPPTAVAGHPLVAALAVWNDNAIAALATLDHANAATAIWIDAHGVVQRKEECSVTISVAARPGLTSYPLALTAPDTPGQYRLRIAYGTAVTAEHSVDVQAATTSVAPAPSPLQLRRIDHGAESVQAGDALPVTLVWQVDRALARRYHVTVQLLDDANHPVAQWDGMPFDNRYPTDEWEPGTAVALPVQLPIDRSTPPGAYRLMVALYDDGRPEMPRLPLTRPDGTVVPEVIADVIQVR